jgi:glycerol-3-phosphate dehydrogenase
MGRSESTEGANRPKEGLMEELSWRTRNEFWKKLGEEPFDLVVIGGGITGAGIARDAAMRGLRTVLVEKRDFARGTSSYSSKLVHGGLRYLAHMEFGLVYDALTERRVLLDLAPHLVEPLPFLFPVYGGGKYSFLAVCGALWSYSLLSAFSTIGWHRMLSRRNVLSAEPALREEGLEGGGTYFDCGTNDARLVMETLKSAADHGAWMLSYCPVVKIEKVSGRVSGVTVRDEFSGKKKKISAKIVVNATGPWTDEITRMDSPKGPRNLRPTKGIHIIVERSRIKNRGAICMQHPDDGRMMFTIPWGEERTIIGTTDTDYPGDPYDARAERADIDYVLRVANHYFPAAGLTDRDILTTYAGVRPLVMDSAASESGVSRTHRIFESPSGLLSIAGGKLTTYRLMAKELVDRVVERLWPEEEEKRPHCMTDTEPLSGGDMGERTDYLRDALDNAEADFGVDRRLASRLIQTYGSNHRDLCRILKERPEFAEPLPGAMGCVKAEAIYAVRHEMALHLDDFMVRRTWVFGEAADAGRACAREAAVLMGKELGWDAGRRKAEIKAYDGEVKRNRVFLTS